MAARWPQHAGQSHGECEGLCPPRAGEQRHGLGKRPHSGQGQRNRPRTGAAWMAGGERKGRGESPGTSPCPAPLPLRAARGAPAGAGAGGAGEGWAFTPVLETDSECHSTGVAWDRLKAQCHLPPSLSDGILRMRREQREVWLPCQLGWQGACSWVHVVIWTGAQEQPLPASQSRTSGRCSGKNEEHASTGVLTLT